MVKPLNRKRKTAPKRVLRLPFAAENWKLLPGLWGDAFRQRQIAVLVRQTIRPCRFDG
jgi:hypothetical protein